MNLSKRFFECLFIVTTLGVSVAPAAAEVGKTTRPESTKYGVYVYDSSHDSTGNADETEAVRRTILASGGRLTTRIAIDTEYLVVGAPPVVPVLTEPEKRDPVQVAVHDAAEARLNDYRSVCAEARALGIPVLTQDQFLTMCGSRDIASR